MRHVLAVLGVLVVWVGSAAATPTVLRDGANHHLGDDSFIARFGRAPTASDSEDVRMHVHLSYVRETLESEVEIPGPRDNPADLATYLTESMSWYIEWPHVDHSFGAVYATLPGYHAPPDAE